MTEPHVWTIDDHLRGADPQHVELFRDFVRLVEACGPVELVAHKTTVSFHGTRRGFAGARPDARGGWSGSSTSSDRSRTTPGSRP